MSNLESNLFVKRIRLDKDKVEDFNSYPFNIETVKSFTELKLNSPVTFLVGENGIGKSTFIEAIAVACGLNPEGGSQNFNFSTNRTHSKLWEYMHVDTFNSPRTKFFLRAESFYNVASEIERISKEGGEGPLYPFYGGNLHECSHGESFIKLVQNRFLPRGLYILDEPEAALSPMRQMTLLTLIDELVKQGSQFIIATHSPILIAYRNGTIYDLNNKFNIIKYKDTEIYQIYKMFLDRHEKMQEELFDAKD